MNPKQTLTAEPFIRISDLVDHADLNEDGIIDSQEAEHARSTISHIVESYPAMPGLMTAGRCAMLSVTVSSAIQAGALLNL